MSGVWIFAEQKDGKFRQVVFEMLGAGRRLADHLGEPLVAVVFGRKCGDLIKPLAEYGADRVLTAEHELFGSYTTDGWSRPLAELARTEQPRAILFAHSSVGRDLAPTVAQKLDAGQISDVVAMRIEDGVAFHRPIYSGKAFAWMEFTSSEATMIVTVRPKSFELPELQEGRTAETRSVAVSLDPASIRQKVREVRRKASHRVELTEADVVISGGRGLKSKENFQLLEEIADLLGGAVGASRAAVDEGFRESHYQVGQTGKVVAPNLYIACGISGAIQHLAGISRSKVIVAINKDPEAEIFNVADYGVVGDLFEILPELLRELQKRERQVA